VSAEDWLWHVNTLHLIRAGKITVTEELMARIKPGWKDEFVEAICLRKVGSK
jgi:hypothetical protein